MSIPRSLLSSSSLRTCPAARASTILRRTFVLSAITRSSLPRKLYPSELLRNNTFRHASTATASKPPPPHIPPSSEPTIDSDTPAPPDSSLSFQTIAAHVHPNTLKAITVRPFKYTHMSPVQAQILPLLPQLALPHDHPDLAGATTEHPRDLLVKAKTGTGKTMAFLVPAIESRLNALAAVSAAAQTTGVDLSPADLQRAQTAYARKNLGTLIISPTRELASQIAVEATNLTAHHRGFQVQLLLGGESKGRQMREWRYGRKDIVVATPGRLLDLINTEPEVAEVVSSAKMLILDEADTLLDLGFREDIERITGFLPPSPQRQTFLFSATVSRAIQQIAASTLSRKHRFVNCVAADDSPVHAHIPQYHTVLRSGEDLLPHVLRLLALDQLENQGLARGGNGKAEGTTGNKSKVIIFLSTTNMVILFSQLLRKALPLLPAGARTSLFEMHAKRDMRQRTRVSTAFRSDTSAASILVTSDVSARGVDYPGVTRVVQVGCPSAADIYVHRVGRTGRGGRRDGRGDLVLMPWEMGFVKAKLGAVGMRPVTRDDVAGQLEELVSSLASSETKYPAYTPLAISAIPTESAHITSQLASYSGEQVQGGFASQLGFFIGHAKALGLEMLGDRGVLKGLREMWVGMWGLEREPVVGRALKEMLGGEGGFGGRDRRGGRSSSSSSRGGGGWAGRGRDGGEGGGGMFASRNAPGGNDGYGYAKGSRAGFGAAKRWGEGREGKWETGGAGGFSERSGSGRGGRNGERGAARGYGREKEGDGAGGRREGKYNWREQID
ncbi:hypothetical protein GALMADRAFT_272558 [Galerina marginata CBS 339.88]|uniref:ATP-dependent RNA helicase n=1 Tax=Galerina marginata (strain CBS 339.88) TaxID=685588 RepID=A0A067SNG5_GALM3|nr:hypothetical protein GALMADRAFT_272558 [Galerina marginata CBS 339.88]